MAKKALRLMAVIALAIFVLGLIGGGIFGAFISYYHFQSGSPKRYEDLQVELMICTFVALGLTGLWLLTRKSKKSISGIRIGSAHHAKNNH